MKMKNIFNVHLIETLFEDVENSRFSLYLEKSNDIRVTKVLGIAIKLFQQFFL